MKMIFTCLVVLSLYSCATSSLHSESKKETQQPYRRILPLYIEEPLTLREFDSAFYTDNVRDRFNVLRTMPARAQMEKSLKRNHLRPSTRIISSSEVLGVNENVDYAVFKEKLDNAKVEAILLINADEYWETYSYKRVGRSIEENSEPNSAFHCYLIDATTGEVLWLGRCTVRGIGAGYETLNNMLARRVIKNLKREKYIK